MFSHDVPYINISTGDDERTRLLPARDMTSVTTFTAAEKSLVQSIDGNYCSV